MDMNILPDAAQSIQYANPAIPLSVTHGDLKTPMLCHWHEEVELMLPIRGHLTCRVNNQCIEVAQGNAIFINSHQLHFGFSEDGSDCEYICICFRPELLCFNGEIGRRFVFPILTDPDMPWMLLRQDKQTHKLLLNSIRSVETLWHAGQELPVVAKLLELWNGLYENAQPQPQSGIDGNTRSLRQMLEFIRTHYSERISLEKIAAAGGVCRSKCCQLFKQFMQHSPNHYLNSFRLEKAVELLENTNASISEIAGACGFGSSSYFSEIFLQNMGCSPRNYRKR